MSTDITFHTGLGDDPPTARLIYGVDIVTGLKMLSDRSIHTICTSPPYWGLRSYLKGDDDQKDVELGAESSPDDFVVKVVEIFREVKRVLRTDGTVWLNLGDTYLGGGRAGSNPEYWARHKTFGKVDKTTSVGAMGVPVPVPEGYKAKDLAGVPWAVANALRADGWYLRAACPWIKGNGMPDAATDRPSMVTEYIFLLAHPDSKGQYFYDYESVRVGSTRNRRSTDWWFESVKDTLTNQGLITTPDGDPLAFMVNPTGFKGAHFATWPVKLVEPMVKATTSAHGVCARCGTPYYPIEHKVADVVGKDMSVYEAPGQTSHRGTRITDPTGKGGSILARKLYCEGYAQRCSCSFEEGDVRLDRPTVLDMFSGSGTTGRVATQLGRNYIGIDLNQQYLQIATMRVSGEDVPLEDSGEQNITDLFGDLS